MGFAKRSPNVWVDDMNVINIMTKSMVIMEPFGGGGGGAARFAMYRLCGIRVMKVGLPLIQQEDVLLCNMRRKEPLNVKRTWEYPVPMPMPDGLSAVQKQKPLNNLTKGLERSNLYGPMMNEERFLIGVSLLVYVKEFPCLELKLGIESMVNAVSYSMVGKATAGWCDSTINAHTT